MSEPDVPLSAVVPTALEVLRPDDLVVLRLTWQRMTLQPGTATSPARLRTVAGVSTATPALLLVDLPPQHLPETVGRTAGRAVLAAAAPGRVVVRLTTHASVELTVAGVLAAMDGAWQAGAEARVLGLDATELEVPYPLVLSPSGWTTWRHAPLPVTDPGSGATAMWTTRLTDGDDATAPVSVKVVAVRPLPALPLGALDAQDAGWLLAHGSVWVDQLELSALGAWLVARGDWPYDPSSGNGLESWRHRATAGRDQYVRTVEAGYLYPFGHRAVKVTITRRRPEPPGTGPARLMQRQYVVVREPVREPGTREVPFRSVECLTLVTPDLVQVGQGQHLLKAAAGKTPVLFDLRGVDHDGRSVSFAAPMAWIPTGATELEVTAARDLDALHGARDMGGQRITYALGVPSAAGLPGDSAYATALASFTARFDELGRPVPQLDEATADVPAIAALTGTAPSVTFTYTAAYLAGAEDALGAFAAVTSTPEAALPAAEAGGVAAPAIAVNALSARFGPIGAAGLDPSRGVDWAQFLPNARLLGVLDLAAMIPPLPSGDDLVSVVDGDIRSRIPRIVRTPLPGGGEQARLDWRTPLTSSKAPLTTGANSTLSLSAVRTTPQAPAVPTRSVRGVVTDLELRPLGPLVVLRLVEFSFTAGDNGKVDAAVTLDPVRFDGPLSFLNAIAAVIPPDGFVDPPAVTVDETGVRAGYSLALPMIAFGAFSLQNVALGAEVVLPLMGDSPRFRFAFSERDHPFLVTVGIFGGGGFFALTVSLSDGEVGLEAALEFGGGVAANIGVASGAITVMAGIYYRRPATVENVDEALAGFFRANGVLEVLGLISISQQFYLELEWSPGAITGTATVTVKVKVAFFSKSVHLTLERTFAGSGDPTFADMLTKADWATYCDAFADEG